MNEDELFNTRIALLHAFLHEERHDGILLSRSDNFAMATGGKRNYVGLGSDMGASSLFVTKDGKAYVVGNAIEIPRQMAEEFDSLGCEPLSFPWFDGSSASAVRTRFSGAFVSDDGSLGENVNGKLAYLRALLTEAELEKYRRLGRLSADAMLATLDLIEAGMTEAEIAASLFAEGAKRGCFVPVCLVAADERIAAFRHPLPTQARLLAGSSPEKKVTGYVMVVGGFVREGLVVSMTRFKQVGKVTNEVRDAFSRICAVDAVMQEATQPGKTLGDVFAACQQAYVDFGFPKDEWHNHHQGGATGYAGRTRKGTPGERFPILDGRWSRRVKEAAGIDVEFGQAFAWNPSAKGVKSEDTFILLPGGGKEIVTTTPTLPTVDLAAVLGRKTDVAKSGIAV